MTSSHWRAVGWHRARVGDGKWKLDGAGFGDLQNDNFLNTLRTFGVRRAVESLREAHDCPEELWKLGISVARSQNRIFSFDCAKQVLALAKVYGYLEPTDPDSPLTSAGVTNCCVIGDGYGYLGALLKSFDPNVTVTSVNLGRGLLFDAYYTCLRFPRASLALLGDGVSSKQDFLFLPAEDYGALKNMPQDLVFNIASMQEMNLVVVQNYLHYIRRRANQRVLFYCCNRIEKTLPDGEIVRFDDYGWDANDVIVFDELCPWYQSFPHGLIPRWLSFDGKIKHRLVDLHSPKNADVASVRI